jgi:esterase/lipase
MITYKVKYKKYIVNMYVPEHKSGKAVLLLPGLPASTNIEKLLNTLLATGAVIYLPNYSGTFDSGGTFGVKSSIKDVTELYQLSTKTKVKELYFGKEIQIGKIKEVILIGMSFGSIIALLGHRNKFSKLILLSSALLFRPSDFPSKELGTEFANQMKNLLSLLKNAFPFSYRTGKTSDLKDFLLGRSLLSQKKSIFEAFMKIKSPTLVLHGSNDTSIPSGVIKSIENEIGNSEISWVYSDSGHNTSSYNESAMDAITDFIIS